MTGCKERIEKFIFDSSKMSNITEYSYKYDSNKLMSTTENIYTLMWGQKVDTLTTLIEYFYNDKGLLFKETSKSDFSENPTLKFYFYNESDSLIQEININYEGDTTFNEKYQYFPDGRKTVYFRYLSLSVDLQNIINSVSKMEYDTIFEKYEYEYNGTQCNVKKQFDGENNLTKTIKYEYQENKITKEEHFTYFDKMEIQEKTKYYDYSKSDIKPDYYSLDSKNDTVELNVNEFEKGIIINSTSVYDYGNVINKTFYEKGKEIGCVAIDKKMKMKLVNSTEYFENGDIKETKSYHEELNAP
ncbi:MAG: hypothetical protein CVU05_13940 [Bacteroidetes bacterium HGW-Bacteroidetes-21]|nr:MAG: hypothetical protein CVU05_13940 [Bacteroidetes bacterium HGW-Bacteroidetes-21]